MKGPAAAEPPTRDGSNQEHAVKPAAFHMSLKLKPPSWDRKWEVEKRAYRNASFQKGKSN